MAPNRHSSLQDIQDYLYSHHVRRPDLEHLIIKYPRWDLDYATNNIRGRWSEAEEVIKTRTL